MRDRLVESSVNKIPIWYGFWDALIMDPVQCEHGLIYGCTVMRSEISVINWQF